MQRNNEERETVTPLSHTFIPCKETASLASYHQKLKKASLSGKQIRCIQKFYVVGTRQRLSTKSQYIKITLYPLTWSIV
jgi:hypothetical protein